MAKPPAELRSLAYRAFIKGMDGGSPVGCLRPPLAPTLEGIMARRILLNFRADLELCGTGVRLEI